MTDTTSPVRHLGITTDVPELAHEYIGRAYVEHSWRFSGPATGFEYAAASTEEDRFGLHRVRYSMNAVSAAAPFPALEIMHVFGGRMLIRSGREEIDAGPGTTLVWDTLDRSDIVSHDFTIGIVKLDLDAAAEVAGAVAGVAPADLRLRLSSPVSAARDRHWRRTVRQVGDGFLREPEIRDSALCRTAMFQTLVLTLLETFPVPRGGADPGRGHEPLAVRRAVEFIEQHAGSDVSLADIAAASGVGARALQQGMRRHRDTTPLRLLRETRLERAHEELRTALPGTTVAAVAARWGFTNPGRFTAAHRRRYGFSPADLLARQTGGTSVK